MDAPVEIQKLIKEHGKLEANTPSGITSEGFDIENPFPPPKLTILTSKMMGQDTGNDAATKSIPFLPPGTTKTYMPNKASASHATTLQDQSRNVCDLASLLNLPIKIYEEQRMRYSHEGREH